MKPNPITRRSFLKTSAFTAGSYLILSRGIALANPGSGNTSDGSFKYVTYRKFRLICVQHPAERIGQAAWLEAANADSLANPTPHSVKVQAEGPFRGESFQRKEIKADWTSSLTGFVSKSVVHRLVRSGITYDERWIKDGDVLPEYEKKKYTNSDHDLPFTMPELGFDVSGSEVTATVVKAGFFIGNLSVSGGENLTNSKVYETSDGKISSTETGAEATLGAPDVSAGGAVSPKSISLKNEIKNKSGFTIKTRGTNVVTKSYSAREGEDGKKYFDFDGSISSTINAAINMDWKIIQQTKTKTVKTLDGKELAVTSETDWLPALPPETSE